MGDMLNDMEKWVVVKECPISGGVLPVNSEIDIVHGCMYFNGGLMDTFYQDELFKLVRSEKKKPNYLRRMNIVYNRL